MNIKDLQVGMVPGKTRFQDVGWLHEMNYRPRADYGSVAERDRLAESFADRGGWDAQHCCVVMPATPQEQAKIIQQRDKLLDSLTDEKQSAVFWDFYPEHPARLPTYIAINCYRRGDILIEAGIKHRELTGKPMNDRITLVWPETQDHRLDAGTILEIQMRENTKHVDYKELPAEVHAKVMGGLDVALYCMANQKIMEGRDILVEAGLSIHRIVDWQAETATHRKAMIAKCRAHLALKFGDKANAIVNELFPS